MATFTTHKAELRQNN